MESFVDGFEEEPPCVQLSLLTATVKLFLNNPDTMDLVKEVISTVTQYSNDPDIRDRGFIYWRLIANDTEAAREIVCAERPLISDASDDLESSLLDLLIGNISSLAAVYHKVFASCLLR